MAWTVAEVKARIVAIAQQGIGDSSLSLTKVFPHVPRALQHNELPALIVYTSNATYDRLIESERHLVETRTYRLTVYAQEALLNNEFAGEQTIDTLISELRSYYSDRRNLVLDNSDEQVRDSRVVGDTGYIILPYGSSSREYNAFEMRLEVSTVHKICYRS